MESGAEKENQILIASFITFWLKKLQMIGQYQLPMFALGRVIFYGGAIDAKPHQHPLWQLCLPCQNSMLNGQLLSTAAIIAPNEDHQLTMPQGWIVLAEPESLLGAAIGELFLAFPNGKLPQIPILLEPNATALIQAFSSFPKLVSALTQNEYLCQDLRLRALLARLDNCFEGACLKPEHWRAREVAQELGISESYFLHLVKSELGISWRPYLLWRRLICAMSAIKNGNSATNAAHLAGFSDSAHLSRTVKATFGMTCSQLLASFQQNSQFVQ